MRHRIVEIARLLHTSGLCPGADGNLSARVPGGFLVTRSGCHKGLMTLDDVLEVDEAGTSTAMNNDRPTSELAMHLACYRARPDVAAIVHAHPSWALARDLYGARPPHHFLPEAALLLGEVVRVPYATTGSTELAERVGKAAERSNAMILERHGAVTLGASLDEACARMETLDHTSRVLWAAELHRPVSPIDGAEFRRLQELGSRR